MSPLIILFCIFVDMRSKSRLRVNQRVTQAFLLQGVQCVRSAIDQIGVVLLSLPSLIVVSCAFRAPLTLLPVPGISIILYHVIHYVF